MGPPLGVLDRSRGLEDDGVSDFLFWRSDRDVEFVFDLSDAANQSLVWLKHRLRPMRWESHLEIPLTVLAARAANCDCDARAR